jgi:hypothetical protein
MDLSLLLAFFAGGSGACHAPGGEREGQSRLAAANLAFESREREGRSRLACRQYQI